MRKPPSTTHTREGHPKIVHRKANGRFKSPPRSPTTSNKPINPAELDQDAGGGYKVERSNIQE